MEFTGRPAIGMTESSCRLTARTQTQDLVWGRSGIEKPFGDLSGVAMRSVWLERARGAVTETIFGHRFRHGDELRKHARTA